MFSPSFELIVSVWRPVDIHCMTKRTRTLSDSRRRPFTAGNTPIDTLYSNGPAPTSSRQSDTVKYCWCRRDFFRAGVEEPNRGFMWFEQPVHTSAMATWSVSPSRKVFLWLLWAKILDYAARFLKKCDGIFEIYMQFYAMKLRELAKIVVW